MIRRLRNPAVLLALLFLAASVTASADEDWKEVRHRDGIRVYIAQSSDHAIVKARAVAVIEAPLETIAAILDDNSRHSEWVPYLLESRTLESRSEFERLEYNRFAAPWPATDRDFVYRVSGTPDPDGRRWRFRLRSEPSPLMAERPDIVRGELFESDYTLTALSPLQTRIELMFHADPRGWVPTWITNIIQEVWPMAVLKGLRKQATKRKTQ